MALRRLILLACVPIAACAVPEARLRTGLESAGLPRPLSACMAERMVDRLSIAQLLRMRDLPKARDSRGLPEFLRSVRALGDPEILAVSTSSAAVCAVRG